MIGRKSRAYGTLSYTVYGKITQLKTTSTHIVPRVVFFKIIIYIPGQGALCTFLAISFFPFDQFLFIFFCLKGIICTTKLCNKKYRSPCTFKSKTPSYLSISITVDGNNKIRCVLGMRALIRKGLWVIRNFSHMFRELFQRV